MSTLTAKQIPVVAKQANCPIEFVQRWLNGDHRLRHTCERIELAIDSLADKPIDVDRLLAHFDRHHDGQAEPRRTILALLARGPRTASGLAGDAQITESCAGTALHGLMRLGYASKLGRAGRLVVWRIVWVPADLAESRCDTRAIRGRRPVTQQRVLDVLKQGPATRLAIQDLANISKSSAENALEHLRQKGVVVFRDSAYHIVDQAGADKVAERVGSGA
jgi:predicted transcriptional regulator